MSEAAEETWVRQAQAGERAAFDQLFQRYRRPIFTLIVRLVDSPEAAADLCQETFLRAWEFLPQLRDPARFPGWLRRLAVRLCFDYQKTAPPRAVPEEALNTTPDPGAEEALNVALLAIDVRRALQQLPPFQRAVTVLRFLHGLSYAEIAEALDCPLGTVMSRLHAGRQALRRLLEEEDMET